MVTQTRFVPYLNSYIFGTHGPVLRRCSSCCYGKTPDRRKSRKEGLVPECEGTDNSPSQGRQGGRDVKWLSILLCLLSRVRREGERQRDRQRQKQRQAETDNRETKREHLLKESKSNKVSKEE